MQLLTPKYMALLRKTKALAPSLMPRLETCFQLLSAADAINDDCAKKLAPYGLSEGKFVVLFLLDDYPDGLPPHILAELAGVSRPTITGLVNGLERSGLVLRQKSSVDKRGAIVTLSLAGQELIEMLFIEHTKWIHNLFTSFTPEENTLLRRLLLQIRQMTAS